MNNPLTKLIERSELMYYVLVGALATTVDWTVFSIAITKLGFHYQSGLIIAYMTGGVTHFCLNKVVTFKCPSRELASQISVYALVAALSLTCSLIILTMLIKTFAINKIILRMMTTLFMVLPNYLMHKHITFSKSIFAA